MTKLFKNGKQILGFVLVFAVLAVSLFTGAVVTASAANSVLYWDGTYTVPTDTNADGIYDIDSASDIAYLASKTESETYDSKGKTYKVVDGVKAIVMQPESLAAIKDKTSAAEVKAFFDENAASAKVWQVVGYNGKYPFQGTFDGNGATVYGMYNDWDQYTASADWRKDLYGGLFGLVDNSAVIKNVAVKNSHFTTNTGFIGPIFANSASDGWNAITANKGTGNVTVENCVSANNYIRITSGGHKANAGTLFGSSNQDYAKVNNCLVYGNDAKNTAFTKPDTTVGLDLPLCNLKNEIDKNDVTNVIALGTTPYHQYDFGWALFVQDTGGTGSVFKNVYTDQAIGDFMMYSGATEYNSFEAANMGGLVKVTDSGVKGEGAKTAAAALDWDTVWFAGANGPELRVFHNISTTIYADDAKQHYYKCLDDGCNVTSEKENHTYEKIGVDYICTVCTHKCLHDAAHGMVATESDGDCVTSAGSYVDCPCGYAPYVPATGATPPVGHSLVHHDADCGHCQKNAKKEHWICETCGKIFLTDDIWAKMDTAVDESDLVLDLGSHKPGIDTEGKIVIYDDETGHWYICSVCDGKLDTDSNVIPDDSAEAHDYDQGVCEVCGYECKHDFEPTGKIAVVGDCNTDELSEEKCKICGLVGTTVTRKAGHEMKLIAQVDPTEKMEGTKAHYECELCKKVYTDKSAKTPAKTAELVIPKLVPENIDSLMATVKANNSGKPADTDSSSQSSNQQSSTTYNSTSTPTVSEDGLVTIARTSNVTLESEGKVFPDDAEVKVERINDIKTLEEIKGSVKSVAKKFAAYEITAQSQNAPVQPTGKVMATFNIPDGYNLDRVAVLYVDDNGKAEKLNSTVDKATKTVLVELNHFSKYVIVETKAKSANASNAEESTINWTIVWIIVAVVAVLVIAGGIVLLFLLLAKKKRA
ncbi:MAG: hypothetical protein Q4B40_00380 [Clostridia bacterium]|nr:hypothetical protein [Clostridia bacterium]